MEKADKDWMMIRMVSGECFLLVLAHPGSPGQRGVLWLNAEMDRIGFSM